MLGFKNSKVGMLYHNVILLLMKWTKINIFKRYSNTNTTTLIYILSYSNWTLEMGYSRISAKLKGVMNDLT